MFRCAAIVLFCICLLSRGIGVVLGEDREMKPPIQPGELGQSVNPFIGTGGLSYVCGNLFPGATVPFGMVRLSPDTVSRGGRRAINTSGYYYPDDRVLGFSHTRLSGTGATDGGNFLVIPLADSEPPGARRHGFVAAFSHKHEIAIPGYYALALPDLGITAELTAACRTGMHRYTFAKGKTPRLVIDVTSVLGRGTSQEGRVRILPDAREVEGSVRTFGTFSKRYGGIKVHFAARASRPFAKFGTWSGATDVAGQITAEGNDVGVDLSFEPDTGRTSVELKLALSYVSVKNARANLDAEVGPAHFDQIAAKARDEWEGALTKIRVEGGTRQQRTIFYTGLYHALTMPTVFNDVNGEYVGFDKRVHRAEGFRYFTDLSLWDTFRTVHPLFILIAPSDQRDMVVSLVEMAKQGGYLPRWPSGAGYSNSMFGTPADMVVAETYLKGIRDFDVETAYQAMRKTALGPTIKSRFSGRVGIEDDLKFHYCPADRMKQSVARTLEFCYADRSIALLASALGHNEDAALFDSHAQFYRNLWNPKTQYFQPRDSSGAFLEFRPLLLTYVDRGGRYTGAYVEGSALQWRWGIPFDAEGLIGLFKSRRYFVRELEQFFEGSVPSVGAVPNAYYWHGNQPDIYAAYLFNSAGRPDLTQKWVRWILEKKYGVQENGIDGNDDGGTLSAWYVLSALGLYPTAGSDRYELASPLWRRATISMGKSKLVITTENGDAAHPYVKRVLLNGKLVDHRWLKHAAIAGGGTLHFEMGAAPADQ
jgi:predicted alpha-1,2-mannosidase